MDAGAAAIVAASISTVAGGFIGFTSSFLSSRQSQRHAQIQATLPKQIASAEYVAFVLFKTLSGESLPDDTWDRYISASFWLPENVRSVCLGVLADRGNVDTLKKAQQVIMRHCDAIMTGE